MTCESGWERGVRGRRASLPLAVVLLAVVCGSEAAAQSLSRADVELGGAFLNVLPAIVVGGTGWISEGGGLAARVYLVPGDDSGSRRYPVIEAGFRYRRWVQNVEVDVGAGAMTLRTWERRAGEWRATGRQAYLTMDLSLGRRLAERLGVKVGAGLVVGGGDRGFVTRISAVMPLGSF